MKDDLNNRPEFDKDILNDDIGDCLSDIIESISEKDSKSIIDAIDDADDYRFDSIDDAPYSFDPDLERLLDSVRDDVEDRDYSNAEKYTTSLKKQLKMYRNGRSFLE